MAKRWTLWTGRIVSALPVLLMGFSSALKLMHHKMVMEAWSSQFGYPESALVPIGVVELLCALVYAVPRTAVLGAVLVTGYLGGAVATHVRAGQPFVLPLALGVLAWVGLYLRDDRLRPLLPLRQRP